MQLQICVTIFGVLGIVPPILLQFMNSEYVCAAEHVSQVCIDNSEEYFPLHEVFVGHNTLSYLEKEDGLSSENVRKFRGDYPSLVGCCSQGSCQMIT